MSTLINPAPRGWQSQGWVDGSHRGTDKGFYNADLEGTKEIVAAAAGKVISVYTAGGYNGGWGNHVIIDHGSGFYTTYSHMRNGTVAVSVGQQVSPGTFIGRMGSTGKVTGDHLHFEVRINGSGAGNRVDPGPWLAGRELPGTGAPAGSARQQRSVRADVGTEGYLNGRLAPITSSEVRQKLAGGVVGNFDAFIRGQQVTVDGVTSDIWFRGAFNGNFFAAAGFTSQSTDGLQDLGSAAPAPAKQAHVHLETNWWGYKSEADARAARNGFKWIPAGNHRIDGGSGPYNIFVGALGRNAWVGSSKTNPPVVYL